MISSPKAAKRELPALLGFAAGCSCNSHTSPRCSRQYHICHRSFHPNLTWNRVSLALDYLSRIGKIVKAKPKSIEVKVS